MHRRLTQHAPAVNPPAPAQTPSPGGDEVKRRFPARVMRASPQSVPSSAELAVVVPTRHESGNVAELVRRLEFGLQGCAAEVLFVDDSDDDTPAAIRAVAGGARVPVRLLARRGAQRVGGLGGAVVAGLRATEAPYVVVMDADLQHPPEVVPALLAKARSDRLDLVVASRRTEGGDASGLSSVVRTAVSATATVLTRFAFPRALRRISDPMSGFFLVRRDRVDLDRLQPQGFKILLEILARNPDLSRGEVGFAFADRFSGTSKASLSEGMRFARHLARLERSRLAGVATSARARRAIAFGTVGISGLVVNSLVLAVLVQWAALAYGIAAVFATQASSSWNWLGSELVVFRGAKSRTLLARFWRSMLLNNAALVVRVPILAALIELLGMNYLVANAVTLTGVFALRFLFHDRWIYLRRVSDGVPIASTAQHGI